MIEIVFSESACGGLKIAQHFGEGEYSDGVILLYYGDNGEKPTPEERQAAQEDAERQARLEWENAVPMGGNTDDIVGFDLLLSVGNISSDGFGENRQETIHSVCRRFPSMPKNRYPDVLGTLSQSLKNVLSRASNGEDVRIWYSNDPDEMCGLYWFMAELQPYEERLANVYIVKLPEYENYDHSLVIRNSWGEMSSGEYGRYVTLAQTTTANFRNHCADQWSNLQKENAPLRVVLNGQLVSAPETIYDFYILREIIKQEKDFMEGAIICDIMNNYLLGIGDDWIHQRIDNMIADGKLIIVKMPDEDYPASRRLVLKSLAL